MSKAKAHDLQVRGRTRDGRPRGTAIHSVRIAADVWAAATEEATAEDRSVGDVIRELLDGWLQDKGRHMS